MNNNNYKNDYPLSNIDLNKFISQVDKKGVNIVDVDNIKPNTDIEDIFKDRGHVILFSGPNTGGHWVCVLRNREGDIYFIDSFGENPNHYSKNILKCFENNNIKNVHINKQVLQEEDSQTCGRYGIILVALNKMEMNPSTMIDFLKDGEKKYKTIDNYVLELTKEI